METEQTITLQMLIPGLISTIGSSFMIISYCIFPNIRKLKYHNIVFFISINDFLASIGVSLGDVRSNSPSCWYQGISTNYNYLVSIFYTVLLSYQLYFIIQYQVIRNINMYVHSFCWIFPLIVTLLPLTTNTYGDEDDSYWCFISNRSNSPSYGIELWTIMAFYMWIWIAIIIVSIIYIKVFYKLRKTIYGYDSELYITLRSISLYPLLLIVCWGLTSVLDISYAVNSSSNIFLNSNLVVNMFGSILPALQGFLHSLIFVFRNQTVLNEWKKFIHGNTSKETSNSLVINRNMISDHTYIDSNVSITMVSVVTVTNEMNSSVEGLGSSDFNTSFDSKNSLPSLPLSTNYSNN